MNIKPIDKITSKYASRGSAAGPDYTAGVASPRRPWQEATTAATAAYAAGVQAAITGGRFERGVADAGNEKWSRKAKDVGSARFGQGVQAAQGDYQKGVAPYLDTLRSLELPPRSPKGSPNNIARVQAVATALRAKKIGG